jgi:hypothetical protein
MQKDGKPGLSVIYENLIDIDELNCTGNFLGRFKEEESKFSVKI